MDIDKIYEKAKDSYKDRKYLYLYPKADGNFTYYAINYDAINAALNSFLSLFDVNGLHRGKHKISEDNRNCLEVWFEVPYQFYYLCNKDSMFREAVKRLGVGIVFTRPFNITKDGCGLTKTITDIKKFNKDRFDKEDN